MRCEVEIYASLLVFERLCDAIAEGEFADRAPAKQRRGKPYRCDRQHALTEKSGNTGFSGLSVIRSFRAWLVRHSSTSMWKILCREPVFIAIPSGFRTDSGVFGRASK
jgi:hypothetical protein